MTPVTMKDDALPQIHLVRDTDLGVFAYGLHILAGDFLRESEFNLRSLATNTGPDSIAIMGKNHIWLADALSAYYPSGELYRMAAMTEYPGTRAFLFHTERKEDGRLYGDVLMTDLDTLRQDIERNTLYPYGVSMEYRDGTKAEAGIEKWEAMELCEKDALKNWSYLYAPEQVTALLSGQVQPVEGTGIFLYAPGFGGTSECGIYGGRPESRYGYVPHTPGNGEAVAS